ncbi:MAG: 2-oxoacid:acceptor oxidoreductase subunit alpha [Anaerolineae bacterium]
MTNNQRDLAWRVGGPQGSGVDTAAGIFARACAIGGLHLYGRREYYSNIIGRHSYYDVRVAQVPLTSHRETIDLLVTFERESLARHAISTVRGGGILYETDNADLALEEMEFLDDMVRAELTDYLADKGLPGGTAGLLQDAQDRGVQTYPIPYKELTTKLAEDLDVPQATADRALNTIAVAISCALLNYPQQYLARALEKTFPGKQKIIDMNVGAVEMAYGLVEERFGKTGLDTKLAPQETKEKRLFVSGNQAVALGKLAAGMTFQTYYPISPATDESTYLEAHETFLTKDGRQGSVVIVQTEDELAAFTMATGAALTGARSATATSGPGFSLMAEGLGWAGINEVPIVVTLYQRGSPSTGLPTRSEQGDLLSAIHASHGEFPRIVFSSGDIEEAFSDAAEAFNYAERYQMPVIHLLDKALASTTQTVVPFDVDSVRIERGALFGPVERPDGDGSYLRFADTESGISPRALLGQPGGMHWTTGGEHTEQGRVTEDPGVREQQVEKRARKLELAAGEMSLEDKLRVYGDPEASFTVASWGSTKGGILEAISRMEADGVAARLIHVRLLWPFPVEEIAPLLESADPLTVVESNFSGQFGQLLRQQAGLEHDHLVVKYNGRPMSGQELFQAFEAIHQGNADRKIVIRNPFE